MLADGVLCFPALHSLMRETQTRAGTGRKGEDWLSRAFPLVHVIES